VTTVAYAMTDLGPSSDGQVDAGTVSVSEANGGCGKQHKAFLNEDGRPCIECAVCAPVLIGGHYGWSATPNGVPLTPDEIAERELAERDGIAMQRVMMKSVTDHFIESMAAKGAAGPALSASTLAAQLAALPAAERAEIAKLLAPGGVPPASHPATLAEGKPAEQPAKDPSVPAGAAMKRPPGRPRKTAN